MCMDGTEQLSNSSVSGWLSAADLIVQTETVGQVSSPPLWSDCVDEIDVLFLGFLSYCLYKEFASDHRLSLRKLLS